MSLNRATAYYQSRAKDQTALKIRLRDLAASRVRYGYRRLHVLLQREGWQINHKRVYRIYRQEGSSLRLKCAKSRVSPALEADFSLSGQRVVAVLDALAAHASKPKVLHIDNGPEFISKALDAWAHQNGVHLAFSRPGTPTDNPYIEAFNGRLRQECLNQNGRLRQECLNHHWFLSLDEASAKLEAWRVDYNTERPHSALGLQTPDQFVKEWRLKAAKHQET